MSNRVVWLLCFCTCTVFASDLVGILEGNPFARLGIRPSQIPANRERQVVAYVGTTLYMNNSRAVVSHMIDDTVDSIPAALEILDELGIKATLFVSARSRPSSDLWRSLGQAVANGHEIGSRGGAQTCACNCAFSPAEIVGSRDDILENTGQSYVWSWAYGCGKCASLRVGRERLKQAGYIVARRYADAARPDNLVPNLWAWDSDPYNAAYTQMAQAGGLTDKEGRIDVAALNAKFDEVYSQHGIYTLMSSPKGVDLSPSGFYSRHLAHIAGRQDVWYVPIGPLYGYEIVREHTEVRQLRRGTIWARYAVYNDLDPRVYNMSITLKFIAPAAVQVFANRKRLPERKPGATTGWSDQYYRREPGEVFVTIRPNTILEFR